MQDVFVAHVADDADIALHIASGLERAGYTTWTYEIDGIPGSSYLLQTRKAIRESGSALIIISPHSMGSWQVNNELIFAHESGKELIVILCGITHHQFQDLHAECREAIGTATLISIPFEGLSVGLPHITTISRARLRWMLEDLEKGISAVLPGIISRLKRRTLAFYAVQPDQKTDAVRRIALMDTALTELRGGVERPALSAAPTKKEEPGRLAVERPPTITPEVPGGTVDWVHFSVTSPSRVQPGHSFTVGIWAHLEKHRQEVVQRVEEAAHEGEISITSQEPVKVERGTLLAARLELEDFIVQPTEPILWEGETVSSTFAVKAASDANIGPIDGMATICKDGFQIAVIYFKIHLGKESRSSKQIRAKVKRHRKAFASYASADRDEVMSVIMGLQKGLPDLDVLVDVDGLRAGMDWTKTIYKEIKSRDVFYLFWSDKAERSDSVEREWRCALAERGLDFIVPCPLVDPKKVPPPKELAGLPFNERWLALRRTRASPSAPAAELPESEQLAFKTPPTVTPEVPGGRVDRVHFSVTSPSMVQPNHSFTVGIWAHLEKQRQEVVRRAAEAARQGEISVTSQGPVKVEPGTVLTVRLELEDFIVQPTEAAILWEGDIGNVTFGVKPTGDVRTGPRVGMATICKNGFQIAVIYFELQVGKESTSIEQIKAEVKRHRRAFASYASADRDEVMLVIMGLQKGLPDLDVFVDVDGLRSGTDWWKRIREEIPSRDIFYLFWSANARRSTVVQKEWRCALAERGLSFIDPCPLVDPKEVPPPKKLARLHFNERWLAYRSTKSSESADSDDESIQAVQ